MQHRATEPEFTVAFVRSVYHMLLLQTLSSEVNSDNIQPDNLDFVIPYRLTDSTHTN